MSATPTEPIVVSAECIEPARDLYAELQARQTQAVIQRHKAALAEVTSPEFAEWAYTPTALETYGFLGVGGPW